MLQSGIIQTGARLHFGLLDTKPPFGGVGAMIDAPATQIRFRPADRFSASSSIKDRAVTIARRFVDVAGLDELPAVSITVDHSSVVHCGFGSGTQLSMAIAESLCMATGFELSMERLACEVAGRGERSAIGVHGYVHGGLIHESIGQSKELNSIARRIELPSDWRVMLVYPDGDFDSVFGEQEKGRFAELPGPTAGQRKELSELLCERMLPAAAAGDLEAFGDVVTRYNHASGMLFAPVQGGAYNGEAVGDHIAELKSLGAHGAGQSSWGPGVFAWCENSGEADRIASAIAREGVRVAIARPLNRGRTVRSD